MSNGISLFFLDFGFCRSHIYMATSKEKINEIKAESHEVIYVASGQQHHYKVKSGLTQNEYNCSIKFNCDCQRFSIYGAANGWICSHLYAVLKRIVEDKRARLR